MAEETKQVESKERYELASVPTQTAIVIKDNETDSVYRTEEALAEILNKLDKIDKNTG